MINVLNEMPHDRITDKPGRWILRHTVMEEDTHVFLTSSRAPEGTTATELIPEELEILSDFDEGSFKINTNDIKELIRWP